ncbi:hypothetical protein RRG08_052178 [Elysia crispata]|uniref:G-protein coupled receptors family 1 profile domain-containing protein n=1 Tax=Elysia crispata TaxID=231223 RepID=A0AAE1D7E7_9GAST|nr:hypothetical protein RRG08_052178 [Elysia crispata]
MELVHSTENVSKVSIEHGASLSYSAGYLMLEKILASIWPAIILFGWVSNIINIVVFLKSGNKDNVTTLLLSLAVSDFVFLTLITPSICGSVIRSLLISYSLPFDVSILLFLLYWPAFTAYDLSAFISVSLGVMRCACVAMPLKFKFVFTRSRTIKWVIFLAVLAVSLRLPVFTIHRISWRTDPQTNMSSPYLKGVNYAYMAARINDILNRGIVIYILYITMVTCVAVLTFKLYQASKIRRACTTVVSKTSDQAPDKPAAHGLSSKDIQVVKSVVMVCMIFTLAQLPFLFLSSSRLFRPDFGSKQTLAYLFAMLSHISLTCSYLNASINIFVYYRYNTRYRSVLRLMLSVKNEQ